MFRTKDKNALPITVREVVSFLRLNDTLDERKWLRFKKKYQLMNAIIFLSVIGFSLFIYHEWKFFYLSLFTFLTSMPILFWQTKNLQFMVRCLSLSEIRPADVLLIKNTFGFRGMRDLRIFYTYEIDNKTYGTYDTHCLYPWGFDESEFQGLAIAHDPLNPEKHLARPIEQKHHWKQFNLRKVVEV